MKWYFASLVLLGLITVVAIISFKGGESMSLLPKGSEAGIALSSSNVPDSNTFQTATFALG